MGATVTVLSEYQNINYEFDRADDGVDFKKDIEKGFKKDKIKRTIKIKKTKDVKPEPKPKRYHGPKFKF